MTIGVFDSGVGGLSVTQALQRAFPNYATEYVTDKAHLPYGNKTPSELLQLVTPILQAMATRCDLIVIACNTVTTTIITELRNAIAVPLVGIEPMVKPAATATKTGIIAICATPTTLHSQRYAQLKAMYAAQVKVLEPDCSDWAAMIEHNQVDDAKIQRRIAQVIGAGADVIVLGCTHYHWIEEKIRGMAQEHAMVIQPEQAIVAQVRQVIAKLLN